MVSPPEFISACQSVRPRITAHDVNARMYRIGQDTAFGTRSGVTASTPRHRTLSRAPFEAP
jgi:hypothetical protein